MKYVFFDLETTGTSPAKHGIHQISGMVEVDGVVVERFDFKVRPNPVAVIDNEALSVSGVSLEEIMAYPAMGEVYAGLVALLGKHCDKFNKTDKYFLVGYNNCAFDNQFLRGFFLQNGDKYFGSWFWSNTIDVMVLATVRLLSRRSLMPDFKLRSVAAAVGVCLDEARLHDAAYDVEITREVFYKVCDYGKAN